jgi:hypothetical protein
MVQYVTVWYGTVVQRTRWIKYGTVRYGTGIWQVLLILIRNVEITQTKLTTQAFIY